MTLWLTLTCALLTLGAAHAAPSAEPVAQDAGSQTRIPGDGADPTTDGYRIVPGDVLRIAVWREPELSGEVTVRLDGRITVPLVGELKAAERSPDDLAAEIQRELERFVEVPQVTLSVAQTVSARFYVLGEVAASGAYPLQSRINVLQALALAGGFREFAKRTSIKIIRYRDDGYVALSVDYKQLEAGEALEQNVFLQAGDTILVP